MPVWDESSWSRVPRLYLGSRVEGYRDAVRPSCRGIVVLPDGRLLMTTTDEYHEYVFAGGGAEEGEDDLATLVREVSEETGYAVQTQSCTPFAYVEDVRNRDDLGLNLTMVSKYFLCRAKREGAAHLDAREAKTGLRPCAVSLEEALRSNGELLGRKHLFWVARDQAVLEMLRCSEEFASWLRARP